jgi:hypothetical protein
MSLTANFDYCVELGIASVREIFHLAFKTEDRYPHNVGPFVRMFQGHDVRVTVRVHDDQDRPADLRFQDEKHVVFSFPFDLTAETPDSPDPALSRITLRVRVDVPALLTTWDEDGEEVLGLSFFEVTPADVVIQELEGLPTIDVDNFRAAVHRRYDGVTHTYTFGGNTLLLYDDARDATLDPPNLATPSDITADLESHAGTDYLKITAPIHVDVPLGSFGVYRSYGRVVFWREVERTDMTVSVHMGTEPADPALATQVELDNAHPARAQIIAQLQPLLVTQLGAFGTITEPALSEAAARQLLQNEIAAYVQVRRYPVYSPKSPDPTIVLYSPVGFLLVGAGVLAILLNRRDDTVPDHAPDDFLGSREVALAVGRERVDEFINEAIDKQFPDFRSTGSYEVHTSEGDATLHQLSVAPSDPGSHGESEGHLWVAGEAEVHIDCWPDPDVSFDGPIFVHGHRQDTDKGCGLVVAAQAGEFDIDESCCDVLLDLVIPIVGWIVLAIVEDTIDEVGGELVDEIAGEQGRVVEPIAPVVNGIAQVTACLEGVEIFSQGFVYPGEIEIRRLGESFEDRAADNDLPRP